MQLYVSAPTSQMCLCYSHIFCLPLEIFLTWKCLKKKSFRYSYGKGHYMLRERCRRPESGLSSGCYQWKGHQLQWWGPQVKRRPTGKNVFYCIKISSHYIYRMRVIIPGRKPMLYAVYLFSRLDPYVNMSSQIYTLIEKKRPSFHFFLSELAVSPLNHLSTSNKSHHPETSSYQNCF